MPGDPFPTVKDSIMKLLMLRWNEAKKRHGGKSKDVATDTAALTAADPELRNEAAAIVPTFILQPGLDAHADALEEDSRLGERAPYQKKRIAVEDKGRQRVEDTATVIRAKCTVTVVRYDGVRLVQTGSNSRQTKRFL
jgi:hypothetical protein